MWTIEVMPSSRMVVKRIGTTTIQSPVWQVDATKMAAERALAVGGVPDDDDTLISATVR